MKNKNFKQKLFYIVTGVAILFLAFGINQVFFAGNTTLKREPVNGTVVVAQPSDPYYSLAQKIAQSEDLKIVADVAEIFPLNPQFVLLVASPENLTEDRLLTIGLTLRKLDDYPGLGIISGSTLESAERLWKRGGWVQKGGNYVAGDVEEAQRIAAPTIFDISSGEVKTSVLNKENLIETLKKADYIYWSRHVSATKWYWNTTAEKWGDNDRLITNDIPQLKPVVIYTPSCASFRPWSQDSIAVRFIDQGAAAYLGNVNSPTTNAFFKQGLAVQGLSSWKEFPLGLVGQVQNKMEGKTYYNAPQFFMLGDPRIYLSKEQPYQIVSDTIKDNQKRIIAGKSNEKGVLALKIEDGAKYDFVAIKGLTSVSENDLFYNSKLQTLNLGSDKYILFLHKGGSFEIELSPKAPFLWGLTDALMDAFDYSWVVLWLDVRTNNVIGTYIIPWIAFIVILPIKCFIRKKSLKEYRNIFLVSLLFPLLHLGYYLVRLGEYSVNANYANYSALQIGLGCLGNFAGLSAGLILMKDERRIVGKIFGLLLAVLPQFMLSGFYFGFITAMNIIRMQSYGMASSLYNYNSFWLPFIVLVFELVVIFAVYRVFFRSSDIQRTSRSRGS